MRARRGAAPSRLHPRKGLGVAAPTDRAQSRPAGGETVSLEPARAQSVLLRRAPGGRCGAGARRPGRYGPLSGSRRQAGHRARAGRGRFRGAPPDSAHARQTRADRPHPAAHARPGAPPAAGAPPEPDGGGMSSCLMCGGGGLTTLFHGSDRLYRTTTKQFSVVRCNQCGLLRLDPTPTPEELGSYYPDNYWFVPGESAASRLEEAYRRVVLRDHVRFVARALADSTARGPLLDVGCGGGLFLGMMRQRGLRVVGLDFSREAAGIAWRRQQVPALAGDLERAPLRAGSFAGLTMFHVMEHLYHPRAFLRAAHELLAPDGRLVVQVPNAASWQARLLGRACH